MVKWRSRPNNPQSLNNIKTLNNIKIITYAARDMLNKMMTYAKGSKIEWVVNYWTSHDETELDDLCSLYYKVSFMDCNGPNRIILSRRIKKRISHWRLDITLWSWEVIQTSMIFEPQWYQARSYLKCSDFTELFANTGKSD